MINGLILIGGKSSRMGRDKYEIPFHDKAQYQHISELLQRLKIPFYISCNKSQESRIVREFNTIVDQYDSIGPMGGILSAKAAIPDSAWLVIACDLPFISQQNIETLLQERNPNADITTFQLDDRFYETTFSIYEPSAFRALSEAAQSGNYRLQAVLRTLDLKVIKPKNPQDFLNVNTPADLKEFRRIKQSRS